MKQSARICKFWAVVPRAVSYTHLVIKVAVIGRRLDEETQQKIQDSLAGYTELKDMKVFLTQTEYSRCV